MNVITEEINSGHFILYILFGVLIFISLELIRYIVPMVIKNQKVKSKLSRYFPVAELLILFTYLVWGIPYIISKNSVWGMGMLFLALIILSFISWFALKDIVAGMIFKSGKNMTKGTSIKSFPYTGNIDRLGLRHLVIKTNDDLLIYLPYGKLIQREVEVSSPKHNLSKLQFTIEIENNENAHIVTEEIRKSILLLPWVSTKVAPQIEVMKVDGDKTILKIGLFALSSDYMQSIEKHIRKNFEK